MAIVTHKCNCYYRLIYSDIGLLSVWSPVQKFRVDRQYYFRETDSVILLKKVKKILELHIAQISQWTLSSKAPQNTR